jgi:creatinine amidohydrolase
MENFPWTRLGNVAAPSEPKTPPDRDLMRASPPAAARAILGDGSFGGDYQKADDLMMAVWAAGVEETREALEGPWPTSR